MNKKKLAAIASAVAVLVLVVILIVTKDMGSKDDNVPATDIHTEASAETTEAAEDQTSGEDKENLEEPTTPSSEPTVTPEKEPAEYTYEEYDAMSRQEKQALMQRFETIDAFWQWYDDAKAKYDATRETIEIGEDSGGIDLGELIGGSK